MLNKRGWLLALLGLTLGAFGVLRFLVARPAAPVAVPGQLATSLADTQPIARAKPSRLRRALPALLTLAAVAFMILSAYQFSRMEDEHDAATLRGSLAFFFGVAALAAARTLRPLITHLPLSTHPSALSTHPSALSPALPAAFGAALMALLALINNDRFAAGILMGINARVQFLLLCAGVFFIAWGLGGAPKLSLPRIARRELLVLLVILGFALVLRVWDIETTVRFFIDEIHLSTGVAYFWNDGHHKLLRPIGALMPFPRIFPYWMSEAIAVFGRNFTGLRIIPALIGTLTVGATYFLARQWFNRQTAVAAAITLAAFPPFIHFSRIALINIADPLFGTLMLAFFVRAMRENRHLDYAWAGALLGLTQYFYEGGHLLFPALAALWLAGLLLLHVDIRIHLRRWRLQLAVRAPFSWRGLLTAALALLLVCLPLILTVLTQPEAREPRINDAGLSAEYWGKLFKTFDVRDYLERIRNAVLLFVRLPDSAHYYGGSTPLILPLFAPLFLLGLGYAFRRDRLGSWALLLWIALTVLGNSLLSHSTITARFVLVLPALALLLVIGARETLLRLFPPRAAAVLLALVVIGMAGVNVAYYFGPHLTEYNVQIREGPAPDGQDAILRAAAFPPYTVAHIISAWPVTTGAFADQMMAFFADNHSVRVVPTDQLTPEYLENLSHDVDQAFFVEVESLDVVPLIRRYFDLSLPQFTPYNIPADKAMLLYYYDAPDKRSGL